MSALNLVKSNLQVRSWWLNAILIFCAFMTFIYMPWDIFIKPLAEDQEVWFGYMFTDWGAKITAFPHWMIYAAGMYGLWAMKSWLHPWAALYIFQIAFSMFLWSFLSGDNTGLMAGAAISVMFLFLAYKFWTSKSVFKN